MGKGTLFILGGGGCRAIEAHIGMLKALEEAGVKATNYRGASAGAIVSGFHSSGLIADLMLGLIKDSPTSKLWSSDWRLYVPGLTCYDVYKCDGLDKLIDDNVDESKAMANVVVSVTRRPDGKVKTAQSLLRPGFKWAIKMSKAMPEIFPPVESPEGWSGNDGGVLNNIPVIPVAEAREWDHIYILLCNDGVDGSLTSGLKTHRALEWFLLTLDRETQEVKDEWTDLPNVTILQPPPYDSGLLEWSDGFGLVKHAHAYGKAALELAKETDSNPIKITA